MNEWEAISDFLKEHGREEWGEKVARLTGKPYVSWNYGGPVGVFSTREAAERHDDDVDIEEVIIDDFLEWEYGPIYRATIRMMDGEIYDIGQADPRHRHPGRCQIEERGAGQAWHYLIVYSPISTAHAMQAAMDRREEIRRADLATLHVGDFDVGRQQQGDPWSDNARATPLDNDSKRDRISMQVGDAGSSPAGASAP